MDKTSNVVKHPNRELIALGIRQPWAELILRGIKTIEVRSSHTRVRGPIYVYSSKKLADIPAAGKAVAEHRLDVAELPRGVLVGTIDIIDSRECRPADTTAACVPREVLKGRVGWHLANPQRLATPLGVRFLPYGVWFYPFHRRNGTT